MMNARSFDESKNLIVVSSGNDCIQDGTEAFEAKKKILLT